MAHDEIQPLADVTAASVTLQHKLCTLEQQGGLGGVFLRSELVQTTIQLFRNTQIHSHRPMVPNQYQALKGLTTAGHPSCVPAGDGRSIIGVSNRRGVGEA